MKRRRYSSNQWLEWLFEQPESGQSISKFCAAHGVSENSFYLWRRKLGNKLKTARREKKNQSTSASFVPIEVSPHSHVSIALPCGANINVPADRSSLQLVLQILLEIGIPPGAQS